MPAECSLAASLPSPIPGIRLTQTPDTPVDAFVVATVIDVALSLLLCPTPVTVGGTQPLRQLARCRRLQGGMQSSPLLVVVDVIVPSQSPPSPFSRPQYPPDVDPGHARRRF